MKFQSTRGQVRNCSFEDVLFSGYASDGGLFVPEEIPKLDKTTLQRWIDSKLSYPKIVSNIVRLFVSQEEIPDDVLERCVTKAYSKFAIPDVIGVKKCQNEAGDDFKVAELFHGQTGSFKDYALSLVGCFMEYFLSKKKKNVVILVGTSGDTGSAAISAVEGLDGIDIIVLYPKGIYPVQELQMNASTAKNVHVFAVEGTSDELDIPIKQCFPTEGLCSINSINWARIMIQIAHHTYLYVFEGGEPLDIFVPTGGAGNLSAGVLASLMGIPIKLFVATNANDNVDAFLNKGRLRMNGDIISTPANAMDILTPLNLERLIYLFSNSEDTKSYMQKCEGSPEDVEIKDETLAKIRTIVRGCRVTNTEEIYDTMKGIWKSNKYMICPHTATAVTYFNKNKAERKVGESRVFVIATASPQKFPEAAEKAGISIGEWNGHELLDSLKSGSQVQPDLSMKKGADWFTILQQKIRQIQKFRAH